MGALPGPAGGAVGHPGHGLSLRRRCGKGHADAAHQDNRRQNVQKVFEPLTGDDWQERFFAGIVTASGEDRRLVSLEYSYTLGILDRNQLTAGAYVRSRSHSRAVCWEDCRCSSSSSLSKGWTPSEDFPKDWTSIPPSTVTERALDQSRRQSPLGIGGLPDQEAREFPRAAREDYDSLLTLRTEGYEDLSTDRTRPERRRSPSGGFPVDWRQSPGLPPAGRCGERGPEEDVAALFNQWGTKNSTNNVRFNPVTADNLHFEHMDERGRQ